MKEVRIEVVYVCPLCGLRISERPTRECDALSIMIAEIYLLKKAKNVVPSLKRRIYIYRANKSRDGGPRGQYLAYVLDQPPGFPRES